MTVRKSTFANPLYLHRTWVPQSHWEQHKEGERSSQIGHISLGKDVSSSSESSSDCPHNSLSTTRQQRRSQRTTPFSSFSTPQRIVMQQRPFAAYHTKPDMSTIKITNPETHPGESKLGKCQATPTFVNFVGCSNCYFAEQPKHGA